MANANVAGSIANLWRFPVKSMRGEALSEAHVTERGIVGDRAYALIDTDTGKVVSAKSVKLFPNLFACRAAYVEAPRDGRELPPVRISLADGTSVISDSPDVDRVLSEHFGRAVTLARFAPDDFTIDMYEPDAKGADPAGGKVVDQKLGAALFAQLGIESPIPVGSFFDGYPLSVLTTSTLTHLGELRPETRFDQRRFRMNVIVDTQQSGFLENGWVGHELAIGDRIRLRVDMPVPRCVMTTLAQDELPQDIEVLRALVRHNRIASGKLGQLPCAGVYTVVVKSGTLRVGDAVVVE
jgi:uncharacterized protein